jgi:integrase
METTALVPQRLRTLTQGAAIADQHAGAGALADYRARLAPNTRRSQDADLALFAQYLAQAGITAGDLANDIQAWAGVSYGWVAGFRAWLLRQGHAIASINRHLATVKSYGTVALQAGVITAETLGAIRTVRGYRHGEGQHVDATRMAAQLPTRTGAKKAQAVALTDDQVRRLKHDHPATPQGRRDALLLCLLLDHGLRCGEVAGLKANAIDWTTWRLTFDRPKVGKAGQIHDLTPDTIRAATRYLERDRPTGYLLLGSRRGGHTLAGRMSERAITLRVRALGCRILGIPDLSAHDCRHSWATRAVQGGTDIKALQAAGGWTSPAMPLRYAAVGEVVNTGVKLSS